MKKVDINAYIKANYVKHSDQEIGKVTGLSSNAVRHRRRSLGLKSPFHYVGNRTPRFVVASKSKVLLLDIETAPSLGWYYDLWKEGNIVATDKSWYILSFAWKWIDSKSIKSLALNDYRGYNKDKENDKELVGDLWKLMDAADIIIAHNGDRFDIRKINARLLFHGFNPPSPYKTIDTLKIARRHFMLDSNRLNEIGKYLGVGTKLPHMGFKMWEDCMKGDAKAWKMMKKYNEQDINLLEKVYLKERAWMTSHPNVNLVDMKPGACPTCGSVKLQRRGVSMTRMSRVQRFQCTGCGAWSVGKVEGRLAIR